jgi:CubicO group peptidase (beta-lactamase class C family)
MIPVVCRWAFLIVLGSSFETVISSAAELRVIPGVTLAIDEAIRAKEIAGAVTLVADADKIYHFAAAGMANIAESKTLKTDSLFWIASMTKPITGTAIMMLEEQGLLKLSDPVAKFLPEFQQLKDAAGQPVTVTIQQCLTHTSGLSELPAEVENELNSLAQLTPLVAALPVKFPPASKWSYCQSGINTAARIVEVISGQPFPEFLQQRLFTPLGMIDTTFYPNSEQLSRLAQAYKRTAAGELEATDICFMGGKSIASKQRYPRANGGLFSTAADYLRFAQMMMRGGDYGGTRILKPESVSQMTSILTSDLLAGFTPGIGWGLGWNVVREPQGVSAMLSPKSYGHGGAYGTQIWIDPAKQRIYLLLVQRSNFPNADASEVRRAFQFAAQP